MRQIENPWGNGKSDTIDLPSDPQSNTHGANWKLIGGGVGLAAVAWLVYSSADGGYATQCSDITVAELNNVYQDSLLGKIGTKFLDISRTTDIGRSGGEMKCRVLAVTTHGEQSYIVENKILNNKHYVQVGLDF